MAISLPTAIARRAPRRGADAEFRSILIPVNADQELIPWEMVDVASRLAAERRGVIDLFVFSLIPLSEELDVEIPTSTTACGGWSPEPPPWPAATASTCAGAIAASGTRRPRSWPRPTVTAPS
jgi:hypothetical protein